MSLRKRIEIKKNTVYVQQVNLKTVDPEAGDYGEVSYRRWLVGDINLILANKVYVKQLRINSEAQARQAAVFQGKEVPKSPTESLTAAEHQELFEFACDMVSRGLVGPSAMTKEDLVKLGDWRFVNFMFNVLSKKSALDASLSDDLTQFFLDEGRDELRQEMVREATPGPVGSS